MPHPPTEYLRSYFTQNKLKEGSFSPEGGDGEFEAACKRRAQEVIRELEKLGN